MRILILSDVHTNIEALQAVNERSDRFDRGVFA
jgi:hypothetical protein